MKLLGSPLLLLALASFDARACSYPESPSFAEALSTATSVFVFRVEATQLKRQEHGEAYAEWVEGDIRVVETLKGKPSVARVVSFSTHWCGGLRLDAGHYFLAATRDNSPIVELVAVDQSIINITTMYAEGNPEGTENAGFLPVVRRALAGSPLPDGFPHHSLVSHSWQVGSPPPPPCPKCVPCEPE